MLTPSQWLPRNGWRGCERQQTPPVSPLTIGEEVF